MTSTNYNNVPPVIPNSEEQTVYTGINNSKGMFSRLFSAKGRIRRLEYGISFVIYILFYLFFNYNEKSGSLGANADLALVVGLVVYVLFILQSIKRSHDVGRSGWYILVPFYGIYLLFASGDKGINEYGTDPKQ